jgi:CHRD domain-containing protein
MRRYKLIGAALCAGVLVVWGGRADAGEEFSARLDGFQELGSLPNVTQNAQTLVVTAANPTGAILSDGTGTAKLKIDRADEAIDFTLTYSNVGTTPPLTGTVTQAHIHFGKSRDSGGILVFFCTNLTPPAGPPAPPIPPKCPLNDGTVTGRWTKADVLAIAGQNVRAGDFDALTDALLSNTAYANIHTTALGAGEIRGQIHEGDLDKKHDRHDNDRHDNDRHDHR